LRQIPIPTKDRRRQTTQQQQQPSQQQQQMLHSSQYQSLTFVGNELYAIRKETEMLSSSSPSSQLFLVKLDINQVDQVVYKVGILCFSGNLFFRKHLYYITKTFKFSGNIIVFRKSFIFSKTF